MLNRYQVWIHGIRAATERTIHAASSFEARKELAACYPAAEISDCVAARVWN
jgi:hypothetical protein